MTIMPFTLTMPKLSPTMEEGMITKWHKKIGDYIQSGDVIFEVATDKATVEHAVLDGGYLRKILIQEGKSAYVNQAVAIFTETPNESIEQYIPEESFQLPNKTSILLETSSSSEKSMAIPTEARMISEAIFTPEPPVRDYVFKTPVKKTEYGIAASPLAKKLAKERGIDLRTVKGSGPNHRIVSADLELGQPDLSIGFKQAEIPQTVSGEFIEEPLTPMRKTIAHRLQAAKSFIPHFYITLNIRAENLLNTRSQLHTHGLKISINDFVIRASALALRDHPQMNSGFNSANQTIVRFKTVDIAIAVAVPDGLLTPIIRHADYKNLGEISAEVRYLAQKAKEGKLQREEYAGGSFTISNLGMYGISNFSAIINPPQGAILAVASVEDRPVVDKGAVIPGKIMSLTLSSDHRIIDGVTAANFLKEIQKYLENPAALLI